MPVLVPERDAKSACCPLGAMLALSAVTWLVTEPRLCSQCAADSVETQYETKSPGPATAKADCKPPAVVYAVPLTDCVIDVDPDEGLN
jgi:hypothetical protein